MDEDMSDLERKVCQQIEYYFGDHNLLRDRFLQDQMQVDNGWISLETLIRFNRLNRLTTDFTVIVEALRKSKTNLVQVCKSKTKIRRDPNKPLPEATQQYRNEVKSRTVYIKGFPEDSSLDDIKEWLDSKGKTESIYMRKKSKKSFKGSVFAIFDTVESAKKFVDTPNQKYHDTEMIVLLKADYFAKKLDEKKRNRFEAKAKAKREKEEKLKQAELDAMQSLEEKQGCLLKFSGDLQDQTCREDLHEVFSNHGEIKWINFVRGAKEGIILFKSKAEEALKKAQEAHNGNLQLRERDVVWEILEGDVAREALKKIMEDQQELLNRKKGKGRKGRGGKGSQGGQDRKVKFQGKKIKFDSEDDNECEENGTSSASPIERSIEEKDAPASAMKRPLEESEQDAPPVKQMKTENGAEKQL